MDVLKIEKYTDSDLKVALSSPNWTTEAYARIEAECVRRYHVINTDALEAVRIHNLT